MYFQLPPQRKKSCSFRVLTILYILNIILPTSYKHSEDAHPVGYSNFGISLVVYLVNMSFYPRFPSLFSRSTTSQILSLEDILHGKLPIFSTSVNELLNAFWLIWMNQGLFAALMCYCCNVYLLPIYEYLQYLDL